MLVWVSEEYSNTPRPSHACSFTMSKTIRIKWCQIISRNIQVIIRFPIFDWSQISVKIHIWHDPHIGLEVVIVAGRMRTRLPTIWSRKRQECRWELLWFRITWTRRAVVSELASAPMLCPLVAINSEPSSGEIIFLRCLTTFLSL